MVSAMKNRLDSVWKKLGFRVIDGLGKSRRIARDGSIIVSGGYQNEISYLRIMYPLELRNEIESEKSKGGGFFQSSKLV